MEPTPLTAEEIAIVNRVADLIEKGSQGMKQATGMYFIEDRVCSIGAALRAVGVDKKRANQSGFSVLHALGMQSWPRIQIPTNEVPFAYAGRDAPLIDVIITLNDSACWDFAHIIAWLRSIANEV